MKRSLVVLTLAAALMVPAGRANAQFGSTTLCGGSTAANTLFCALITTSIQSVGSGAQQHYLVTVTAKNISDDHSAALTMIGIDNISLSSALYQSGNFTSSVPVMNHAWTFSPDAKVNGNIQVEFLLAVNGYQDGIGWNETGTFTFTANTPFLVDNAHPDYFLKGQGMRGGSAECESNSLKPGAVPFCTTVTSTPEPASLVLLGTGLLGIFGAVRQRTNRRG